MSEEQPQKNHDTSPGISTAERGIALALAVAVLITLITLVLNPRVMNTGTLAVVRFLAATFAGISGYLFTGNLGLEAKIPLNKTQVRATGAFAAFVLVLFLFFVGVPPSNGSPDQNPQLKPSDLDNTGNLGSNNSSKDGQQDKTALVSNDKLVELVEVYEHRANLVRSELKPLIKYTKVNDYLSKFEILHKRHIQAIKDGQLILAAEILQSIYTLSTELDRDEFWTRHSIETPDIEYSLCKDAFATGDLIELYAGIPLADVLALESGVVPDCHNYSVSKNELSNSNLPLDLYTTFLQDEFHNVKDTVASPNPVSQSGSSSTECILTITNSLVSLRSEPETFSRELSRVEVGEYIPIDYRVTSFGGLRDDGWFLIEAGGQKGWIRDDTWTIDSKTRRCQ